LNNQIEERERERERETVRDTSDESNARYLERQNRTFQWFNLAKKKEVERAGSKRKREREKVSANAFGRKCQKGKQSCLEVMVDFKVQLLQKSAYQKVNKKGSIEPEVSLFLVTHNRLASETRSTSKAPTVLRPVNRQKLKSNKSRPKREKLVRNIDEN
jgi:phenylalanyl-tRNA synthetase alpha subunit